MNKSPECTPPCDLQCTLPDNPLCFGQSLLSLTPVCKKSSLWTGFSAEECGCKYYRKKVSPVVSESQDSEVVRRWTNLDNFVSSDDRVCTPTQSWHSSKNSMQKTPSDSELISRDYGYIHRPMVDPYPEYYDFTTCTVCGGVYECICTDKCFNCGNKLSECHCEKDSSSQKSSSEGETPPSCRQQCSDDDTSEESSDSSQMHAAALDQETVWVERYDAIACGYRCSCGAIAQCYYSKKYKWQCTNCWEFYTTYERNMGQTAATQGSAQSETTVHYATPTQGCLKPLDELREIFGYATSASSEVSNSCTPIRPANPDFMLVASKHSRHMARKCARRRNFREQKRERKKQRFNKMLSEQGVFPSFQAIEFSENDLLSEVSGSEDERANLDTGKLISKLKNLRGSDIEWIPYGDAVTQGLKCACNEVAQYKLASGQWQCHICWLGPSDVPTFVQEQYRSQPRPEDMEISEDDTIAVHVSEDDWLENNFTRWYPLAEAQLNGWQCVICGDVAQRYRPKNGYLCEPHWSDSVEQDKQRSRKRRRPVTAPAMIPAELSPDTLQRLSYEEDVDRMYHDDPRDTEIEDELWRDQMQQELDDRDDLYKLQRRIGRLRNTSEDGGSPSTDPQLAIESEEELHERCLCGAVGTHFLDNSVGWLCNSCWLINQQSRQEREHKKLSGEYDITIDDLEECDQEALEDYKAQEELETAVQEARDEEEFRKTHEL